MSQKLLPAGTLVTVYNTKPVPGESPRTLTNALPVVRLVTDVAVTSLSLDERARLPALLQTLVDLGYNVFRNSHEYWLIEPGVQVKNVDKSAKHVVWTTA